LLNEAIKLSNLKKSECYFQYQLGKSYYLAGDFESAIIYFERALKLEPNYRLEYVEDLVESYGYSLINAGRYKEALSIERFGEFYITPNYYFLMGLIYLNNGIFQMAVECFLACTTFPTSNIDGLTSYRSYYNIGTIFEGLSLLDKALEYYKMCGFFKPAIERIKALES
jgi:tetratricopeptide (TPR) repeat protein